MKSKSFLLLTALLSLAIPQAANAQELTGTYLNIGSDHYTGTSSTNSGVIGTGNRNPTSGTLAVGLYNSIYTPNSLVAGRYNYISGAGNDVGSNAVFGQFHNTVSSNSLVAGSGNTFEYTHYDTAPWSTSVRNSALLGSGLFSRNDNCVVVGKNNAGTERVDGPAAPVFVVGNGASASERSNALEVLANGDIIITKAQGDISMGIYE